MARRKKAAVLVFGEDENDSKTIAELFQALRPDAPNPKVLRKPLVLVKDREAAKVKHNVQKAKQAVAYAAGVRFDVRLVLAHQDCDALEPAHEQVAADIETAWQDVAPRVIGVAPAWEIEAWFYLWPDAVADLNSKWRPLPRTPRNVGKIANAKEQLRRDLRPIKGKAVDYTESDAPRIARRVRKRGEVDRPAAGVTSESYQAFRGKVVAVRLR